MSFNSFVQQGAVKYEQGFNRQTARANIDQTIGSTSDDVAADGVHAQPAVPDNFGWFGLTREHAAADLLAHDACGRLFYRTDLTTVTATQTTNNNPLYFATRRTAAPTRPLPRLVQRALYTRRMADLRVHDGIDERTSQRRRSLRDVGYRSITAERRGEPRQHFRRRASNDLSYNVCSSTSATHNFGADITTRLDLRYNYEDQESQRVGGSGQHADAPGSDRPRQRDDVAHPELRPDSQRANAGIGRAARSATRIATSSTARSVRTAARCSAQTSAITTTIALRLPGS